MNHEAHDQDALRAGVSRRTFLTGAGAAGALAAFGALTGCAPTLKEGTSKTRSTSSTATATQAFDWLGSEPEISDAECKETLSFDVVVIGAGTSGYFAAASAAESGLKTLLLEKASSGSSVRSSALGAVNSKLQQAQGDKAAINVADIVNDMDRYAHGHIDSSFIRMWAENSGEALDWYTDLMEKNGMGVQLEWNMPEGTVYREWPTGHGTNGEDYSTREAAVASIINNYIESFDGCKVRFETPMRKLIMEGGKVVGLYAEGKDGMVRVNASKGVVVATGGYGYNQEMYQALQPTRYSCLGTFDAFPSCTGDGIKALMWAGAATDDVHTSLTFNRCLLKADQKMGKPYETGQSYGYHFYASQPFLRVDSKGRRFHNESAPYDYVMEAIAQRAEGDRFWHQVWDGNWKADVERFHTVGCSTLVYREGADHDAVPGNLDDSVEPEMEQFVEEGYIVKADTLSELADKLGFDADAKKTFLETCERQNANFDAQTDPDFGKEAFRLSELRIPPFYASVKSCGLTLATLDGVRVNHSFQALDSEGNPIEGAYVVGNDQGGFYNGTYPNLAAGLNAGRCVTFGRMVGKILAGK